MFADFASDASWSCAIFGFVALLVSRFAEEGEGVGLYWIFVGLLNCGLMGFW